MEHVDQSINNRCFDRPVALRVIAAVEIFGGAFGILIGLLMMAYSETPYLSIVFVTAPSGLSVLAGYHLWSGRNKGFLLSAIVQSVQIPAIWLESFSYQAFLGFGLFLRIGPGVFALRPTVGATVSLNLTYSPERFVIGINLLSAAVILYLSRMWLQRKSDTDYV